MDDSTTPVDPVDSVGRDDADRAGAAEVGLTDDAVAVLELERSWWKHPGAKETAVRSRFDSPMTRYHQVLNALIDTLAALAHDPVTVHRLRRLRAGRQRARPARPGHGL